MSAVMSLLSVTSRRSEVEVGLGLTSFFVKASIGALREFPGAAEIRATKWSEALLRRGVPLGQRGLVVPVLRDAEQMSFADRAEGSRLCQGRRRRNAVAGGSEGSTFTSPRACSDRF